MKLTALHDKQELDEGKKALALAGLGAAALSALGISGSHRDIESKQAEIQRKLAAPTSHPPAPKGVLKSPYHLTRPEPPTPQQEPIELVPDNLRMNDLSVNDYAKFTAYWEDDRDKSEYFAFNDVVKRKNRTILVRTIGFGYNLDRPGANAGLIAIGIKNTDIPKIRDGEMSITRDQAVTLLGSDIEDAIRRARHDIPNFLEHPDDVKLILVDMTYQLYTVTKLPKFTSYIIKRNYKKAADELEDSLWYKQSKRRAKHHVDKLREITK